MFVFLLYSNGILNVIGGEDDDSLDSDSDMLLDEDSADSEELEVGVHNNNLDTDSDMLLDEDIAE